MIDEELEPSQMVEPTGGPEEQLEQPVAEAPTPPEPEPEPAPQPPAPGPSEPMTMEEALQDESLRAVYDQTFKGLKRGQLVRGTVVRVDPDRVFVDIGTKTEGVIPLAELSGESVSSAVGIVNVGDEVTVVVLQPEGEDGNPVLSKKRADFEDSWTKIEKCFEEGQTITALVTERVKGGIVVDIGVRGFVPATHVGNGKLRNIERFVGQSLPLKILEIDRERRKVVLSNRMAEEERRESAREEIFSSLRPGDIVDGVVRRIVDYGAFVDVGGVDGLLHVSEMSWTRINHPSEVLHEGDEIKVKILRLDASAGKISLGYRQVLPDPWTLVAEHYKVGQILEVPVTRLVQTGAFVKLDEGVEAWLPVSEMAARRVGRPSDVVSESQVIQVQILEVRAGERRMVVSLRALERQSERDVIDKHSRTTHRGGATIGERLGALRDLWKADDGGEEGAEAGKAAEGEGAAKTPADVPAPGGGAEETPAEETPADVPAPEVGAEETPAEETPADVPAPEVGAEETPADVPAPEIEAQEMPAEETPAEETPADVPAPEIEAQEMPAGETPVDGAPAEPPAEEASAEEPKTAAKGADEPTKKAK